MPIIQSEYNCPFWAKNTHISTIWAAKFRKKHPIHLKRQRIELKDGDFIDIDYKTNKNKKAILLLHGLEGNSNRTYMQNMARLFSENKYDIFLMNHRSCSGEDNRLYSCYHSGKSDDLKEIIAFLNTNYKYNNLGLIGFSLGANVILKYLGEEKENTPKNLTAAFCVSPPVDLEACNKALHLPKNKLYAQDFFKTMYKKLEQKLNKFPEKNTGQLNRVKNLFDFDEEYTGPAHGYKNAKGYYTNCSSKKFIPLITLPTYILMAKNDSFLLENCYPTQEAQKNKFVDLEIPTHGGHVGFILSNKEYYSENKALSYFKNLIK